jgi:hypothetical protein
MEAKMKLSRSKQLKLINEITSKIDYTLQAIQWGIYGNQLKKLIRQGEKDHRNSASSGVKHGLSINQAVKLFYAKLIFEGLFYRTEYILKDYLHIRQDVLFAYSLALNYEKELKKCFQGIDHSNIQDLDYAGLMK